MTNLEANKDEIKKLIKKGERFGCAICKAKNKYCIQCCGDDGNDILCNVVDWLLEEHKEPIKLKQWEYDTLKYHGKLSKFNHIHFLVAMKNKGYFKDMNSVEKCSMTIKEILDNCEVIE